VLFTLRGGLFGSASVNTHLLPHRFTCLPRSIFRPFHLQPPTCHFPIAALFRYLSPIGCRVDPPGRPKRSGDLPVTRSGVHHLPAGSSTGLAEASSSSYGLVVHLQLLSTPSHDDAVTLGFRSV